MRKLTPVLARVALVVECVGMLVSSAHAGLPVAKRPLAPPHVVQKSRVPHAWITIGKATTYVTGPVLEDGYIDYMAALNALASAGVTAENNAAVLLAQAIDPASIDAGQRERFYKILGVEPPKKADGLFSDSAAFLTNQGDKFAETIDTLVPWSAEKFPPRARWLASHERALDLAVEATRRSRCYFPMIRTPNAEMIMAVLYGVRQSMEIGRALVARALLRLHEGRIADGIQDLLACHRLARLIGGGPLMLHGAVSRSIEIKACFADAALLQDGHLSAAEALAYRDELEKLAPQPSMADQFDHGERIMLLGFSSELAEKQQPELEDMMVDMVQAMAPSADAEIIVPLLDDQMTAIWDEGMRSANKEWDRWLAAIRTPITAGRQMRFEALEAEAGPILKLKPEDVGDSTLEEKGQWMGRMLATRMLPNLKPDLVVEDRARMRVDLVLLGLALAAYHADNGAYPETLSALVPRYCRAIAGDRFTTKPLVYRLEDKGYVLYSAGDNGIDNGGSPSNADPPGDDIVIRITADSQTRLPLVGTITPRQAKAALLATGLAIMATLGAVAWLFVRASRARKTLLAETEPKLPAN
jgi:hypothetical protein